MNPTIHEKLSPNHDERPAGGRVDMLILHYTGMKTAQDAIDRLRDPQARVSSHYVVDEDGDDPSAGARGAACLARGRLVLAGASRA